MMPAGFWLILGISLALLLLGRTHRWGCGSNSQKISHMNAPPPLSSAVPCYCFDLCSESGATYFWRRVQNAEVLPNSSWAQYFQAVYGQSREGTFDVGKFTFFYWGNSAWYEIHPGVHNPFRPCWDKQQRCNANVCKSWLEPLLEQVNTSLVAVPYLQSTLYPYSVYAWPAAVGLQGTLLGTFTTDGKHRSPSTTLQGAVSGWVEVIRHSVLTGGRAGYMIEEGLSSAVLSDVVRANPCMQNPGCHDGCPGCWFHRATGSGVWVRIGRLANRFHGNQGVLDASAHGFDSAQRTISDGTVVFVRTTPACTTQAVGYGTCPPDELRTGWHAETPCTCNDAWWLLNCRGSSRGGLASTVEPKAWTRFDGPLSLHASWNNRPWPGMAWQWTLARQEVGIAKVHSPAAELSSYLGVLSAVPCRGNGGSTTCVASDAMRQEAAHGSVHDAGTYSSSEANCTVAFNGVKVTYFQVWESYSQHFCAKLREMHDHSQTSREFVFTFVRDPFEHFIVAFSKVNFRAHLANPTVRREYHRCAARGCYQFLAAGDAAQRATKFVDDFLGGRMGNGCGCGGSAQSNDRHALPQAAFIHAGVARLLDARRAIDFVGHIESLEVDWARIGHFVPHWPPFDLETWKEWKPQNNTSNNMKLNPVRTALELLLLKPRDDSRYRRAICRVLLPDYLCFGYELPTDCAAAIGDAHGVTCPFLAGSRPEVQL